MKTLIKNGTIIDGTGGGKFKGDLCIEDDQITAIGNVKEQNFERIIDANGLSIAPGFIDAHSHSDLAVLLEPRVEPKVRQGITTEIIGQDGISMAPLPVEYITPWRRNLAAIDGDSDQINWEYKTTDGYLKMMEASLIGLNESYLVPHGNIRLEAMGLENRQPTAAEMKKMREITRREMEVGAWGLSTGLIYVPCVYSRTEELIELCKVVAKYDGVFVIHQRSEADAILESIQEVIDIGRSSGVKVHFSHLKVCGKKNRDKFQNIRKYFNKARKEGIQISFDQYPYTAGSTMLSAILPPWIYDEGPDKVMERLADPAIRERMIYDMEHGIPGWDNFIDFAGLDKIFVTSVRTEANRDLIGHSLIEIGEIRDKDPYQATFNLLLQEENAVGMVDFYGFEEHVVGFMQRFEHMVCTDGLVGEKPHPRLYGAFPRLLGRYVREQKTLTLEEAIHKMTGKPAEVFGLKQRGLLAPGYYADIVIFNPDTVIDKGDFVNPKRYPEGIEYVLINGKLVLERGVHTGALPGRVLRRK